MRRRAQRSAFSLLELLVVVLILAILSGLTVQLIQKSRERARQASCAVKMKQLSTGLHWYSDNQQKFPTSAFYRDGGNLGTKNIDLRKVVPGETGTATTRAPYSFLLLLLAYIQPDYIYRDVDFLHDEAFDRTNAQWAAKVSPFFLCPSFPHDNSSRAAEYDPFTLGGPRPALTQYKAIGATTLTVLQSSTLATDKNGDGGVLQPYVKCTLNSGSAASSTAWLCETREERYAAWWDGTTASIPGFDPQIDNGITATTTAFNSATQLRPAGQKPVFMPAGMFGGSQDMQWGPSSFHPGLINHAMVSMEVRAIALDIDPKVYASLITRRSDDDAPTSGP